MRQLLISILVLLSVAANAQNIKQTVEVSNEYKARLSDFQKAGSKLVVPDSLYKFNYSFDYSVFDSPYKGAYEFSAYEVKIEPEAMPIQTKNFALTAGLGIMPHPVLNFDWNPVQKDSIGLRISNRGNGRIGRYEQTKYYDGYFGYDLSDNLVIAFRKTLRRNNLEIIAGYDGVYAKTPFTPSIYNSFNAKISLERASWRNSGLNLYADYRYGSDILSDIGEKTTDHYLRINGDIRPSNNQSIQFVTDYEFEFENLIDTRPESSFSLDIHAGIAERAEFSINSFKFDLGIRFDASYINSKTQMLISPLANISVDISSMRMKLYAGVKGGQKLHNYFSRKSFNHFYFINTASLTQSKPLFQDKYSIYMGFKGFIARNIAYKLELSHRDLCGNALETIPDLYRSSISFADIAITSADLNINYISDNFNLDAGAIIKYLHYKEPLPLVVRGSVTGTYNWLKRIYLGMGVDFAAKRTVLAGTDNLYTMDPWADLSLFGKLNFNDKFGAWAKLGNLLFMKMEKQPGFIEKDPYFTLGISLDF